MERKNIQNMDIEKAKELFKHEMTEVLLNLRGEFAVVSRKNTKYAPAAVDEEKMQIAPVVIPELELPAKQVSFPEIPQSQAITIAQIPSPKFALKIPELNDLTPVSIPPQAPAKTISLEFPETRTFQNFNAAAVSVKKADIPAVHIPKVTATAIPAVTLQKHPAVQPLPTTPKIQSGITCVVTPFTPKKLDNILQIHSINIGKIQPANAASVTVTAANIHAPKPVTIKPVTLQCPAINIPDLPVRSVASNPVTVSFSPVCPPQVATPKIPTFHAISVQAAPVSVTTDVQLPVADLPDTAKWKNLILQSAK